MHLTKELKNFLYKNYTFKVDISNYLKINNAIHTMSNKIINFLQKLMLIIQLKVLRIYK